MYFAVKKYLRIGGRHYRPCISYALTESLRSTVDGLVRKGVAETSEKPIFFQNGARITLSEKEASAGQDGVENEKKAPRKNRKQLEQSSEDASGSEAEDF